MILDIIRSSVTVPQVSNNNLSVVFKFSGLRKYQRVSIVTTIGLNLAADRVFDGVFYVYGFYQYPNLSYGAGRKGWTGLANSSNSTGQIAFDFPESFIVIDSPVLWFIVQCPSWMLPTANDYATLLIED